MRYRCNRCDKYVKDKFIFGLVHLCITDEELQMKAQTKNCFATKDFLLGSIKANQINGLFSGGVNLTDAEKAAKQSNKNVEN